MKTLLSFLLFIISTSSFALVDTGVVEDVTDETVVDTTTTLLYDLLDYVVSIESILFIMLILNLFLFGAYLFRITILGKNQRNLW